MHPPDADIVLIRYGEIGVKSDRVQSRMEQRLRDNIESKLRRESLADPVTVGETRLFVETSEAAVEAVTDAVTDVFGVVSASSAVRVDPTMDAIQSALARASRAQYDGGTFAVRARRAGATDAHPFSSSDIETDGGAAVWEAAEAEGIDPAVDLDDPDHTFYVECRTDSAYVFLEKRDGPGGLPVGTQEPLVALVSGGIDSPVAAWLTMKRGCPIVPLYIDLGQYGGVDHRMRARETVRQLSAYSPDPLSLRIAPGGEGIDEIVETASQCQMIVLRRFMFRIAEQVAEEVGAVGIVTGESIGQKSSQTSANLHATSDVTALPIHRPLLGMDKTEITARARKIETYHDSTIDAGCYRIAPDQPATRPPLSSIWDGEPDDIEHRAKRAAEKLDVIDFDHVDESVRPEQ